MLMVVLCVQTRVKPWPRTEVQLSHQPWPVGHEAPVQHKRTDSLALGPLPLDCGRRNSPASQIPKDLAHSKHSINALITSGIASSSVCGWSEVSQATNVPCRRQRWPMIPILLSAQEGTVNPGRDATPRCR